MLGSGLGFGGLNMSKNKPFLEFSEEVAQTVGYLQRVTSTMLSSHSDALTKGKITFPQYVALELLNTRGRLKMKDIAKELKVSLPAVTGLVDRLVSMKMVERGYDEQDRRVIFIALTLEGKKACESIKQARKKIIEQIFSVLTEGERQAYLGILRKIKKASYEKSNKKA